MAYTEESKSKWWGTMLATYGTREKVLAEMKRRKQKGGQTSTTGGFASNKVGADGLTGRQRAAKYGVKKPYKNIQ